MDYRGCTDREPRRRWRTNTTNTRRTRPNHSNGQPPSSGPLIVCPMKQYQWCRRRQVTILDTTSQGDGIFFGPVFFSFLQYNYSNLAAFCFRFSAKRDKTTWTSSMLSCFLTLEVLISRITLCLLPTVTKRANELDACWQLCHCPLTNHSPCQ